MRAKKRWLAVGWCVIVAGAAIPAWGDSATQPSIANVPGMVNLPSFGVSLATPPGWIRAQEQAEGFVIQWMKLNTDQTRPLGVIQMEIQPHFTDLPTLSSFARDIAHHTHSQVTNNSVMIGTQPAIELTTTINFSHETKPPDEMSMIVGRVAEHSGHYYAMFCLAPTPDQADRQAFAAAADSVKWFDLVPPDDSVIMRGATRNVQFPLFNTNMVFLLPDPYRFVKAEGDQESFVAIDYADGRDDATVGVLHAKCGGNQLLDLESAVNDMRQKNGWLAAPMWTTVSAKIGYTGLIQRGPDDHGEPRGPMQFMMVVLGDGYYLGLEFDYSPKTDASKYAAATDAIARSFILTKPKKPTTAAAR